MVVHCRGGSRMVDENYCGLRRLRRNLKNGTSENRVLTRSDSFEFRSAWQTHQRGLLNPPWWSAAYLVAPLALRPLGPRASTTRWEVQVGKFVYRYLKTPSANGRRGERRGTKQDGVCIEGCCGRKTGRGISRARQDYSPPKMLCGTFLATTPHQRWYR